MWVYTLLPKILNMSLTAGIVTVLVLLARILLRKAPKIFSYVLWAVVLFRLVCPVSFSSEFSLLGLFHAPSAINGSMAYIPEDIAHTENPRVDLPLPGISEAINDRLPGGEAQLVADPLEGLMAIASLLWLSGIGAMLVYSAVSLMLLRRKLIGAVRLRENIYLADHIATPFVMGVIRPKIYLPSALTEQEQSYIILHEQTHIRRLDHIFKMIAFLALAVHWFNPLVWVAFVCCVKDMELSCDERVLKEMGDGIKGAYSTSLLSLATGRRLINGSPLAFGEGNIKDRIKNVMNFKKPAAWVVVVSVLLVAGLSIGFAANRANDGSGDYDFYNFSVNGFMLGADTNKMDTSALTPAEPLNAESGYDFNFEEVRYSADEQTGRLRKMRVNVYDNGVMSLLAARANGKDNISLDSNETYQIEGIEAVLGKGKTGWHDREQRLRYMEYRHKEGRLSAIVRFVYTDGVSDGIKHRLVWVIAQSSLPYPFPVDHDDPEAEAKEPDESDKQTVLDYLGNEVDVKEVRREKSYTFGEIEYVEYYVRFRGKTPEATQDADGVYTLCRASNAAPWTVIDVMHVSQYTYGDYPAFIITAEDAVSAYYSDNELVCEPIFDPGVYADYVDPQKVRGVVSAFHIYLPAASSKPPRIIVLTKPQGGEWEVINEGY